MMNATDAKHLASLQAECAFHGAELRLIESDDGGPEFVFSQGHRTQRFGDLQAAHVFILALESCDA